MRFNRIHIPAFGPFTDLEMGLPKDGGDFHLIYGPNEAGKSSLLRALRSLLYGVPGQSQDVFLHSGPQIRIAAELETSAGASRYLQRRKGNKSTLLDANNIALSESEMQAFLSGVDESYFDSMFGMGAEELRHGADSLLKGKGRLGEALFSASLGGTPVDKVVESLEVEAARLFKGRTVASIRKTLKELDEFRKLIKESTIKPEAWEEVEREILRLQQERDKLTEEKRNLANRRSWLERCRDAAPVVGKLRECHGELANLPAMPELEDSFGSDIRGARGEWQASQNSIEELERKIANLNEEISKCVLEPDVLSLEAVIERLHADLVLYDDRTSKRADRETEGKQLKTQIEIDCRDLEISTPIEDLENLRVSKVRFTEAESKANALTAAESALSTAEKRAEGLRGEIQKLRDKRSLEAGGDISEIQKVLDLTKGLEESAKSLAARISECDALRQRLETLRDLLPGCLAQVDQIATLDVPLKATIERFRDDFDELRQKERDLSNRRTEWEEKASVLEDEIKRLTQQRELPTLEHLADARQHRDRGWSLVLKDWKGGGADEDFVAGKGLDEAYPEAVSAADDVSDRLRADAEAVAQLEEKREQKRKADNELEKISTKEQLLITARGELQKKWEDAWKGVVSAPLSPAEMKEWRDNWDEFRRDWNHWCAEAKKIEDDQAAIRNAENDLRRTLKLENGDLLALLGEASSRINIHNQALGAEQAILGQIADKEADLQWVEDGLPELRKTAEDAREAWGICRNGHGLPEGLVTGDAIELLRARRDLFVEFDQWMAAMEECRDLQSKIASYELDIAERMTDLKLECRSTRLDMGMLWQKLQDAKNAQSNYENLSARLLEFVEMKDEETLRLGQHRSAFDSFLQRTELEEEGELDSFLLRHEERTAILARLKTLREALAGFARTEAVEEFSKRVEAENIEELEGALATIDERLAELDDELERFRLDWQDAKQRRNAMEAASDEAARQAQFAENAMASLRQDAERFARLQMAISLLNSRIDRFREQNQGPFMEKASRWFSEITGGAFTGIATTYDEGDQPVIAGQRPDDSPQRTVPINGMSEGTRDQLYLALRLAGLELHLADHEPMPLILDDLLVHFDDERSLRALSALRDFGQHSQVLLFTHHAHLVQLVEKQWGKNGFHFHPLSNSNARSKSA